MFLNGYAPKLQTPSQLGWFLCQHRGEEIPRYALLGELTRDLVAGVGRLAEAQDIPVIHFERGQRKEAVAAPYFAAADHEGIVLIGVAQEKAKVFRACSKAARVKGQYSATRASAFVNHYYFYIWDQDFGPSFIKICSFAPWSIRVWLNGHEWVKRQLEHQQVGYQPLDNGFAAVDDPAVLQQTADRLGAADVQHYFDRWISRLPYPFTSTDRDQGYVHQLSILQLEMSRTEVFDRPLHGRQFFEEVIRDQLDLGRPERMQLLFNKRLPKHKGEDPFRTRIFCADVDPSIHIQHLRTGVKQHWKCDRALRTETTINDAHDFRVGKLLANLDTLRQIGQDINHRLLELERQAHHCSPAASTFEALVLPTGDADHRAPALRFGDPRVVAIFAALCDFRWLHQGLRSRELRPLVEHHLGRPYGIRQASYDLRRLQRKDLIQRIPNTNRYLITPLGRRMILFCSKLYSRAICPAISQLQDPLPHSPLTLAWRRFDLLADSLLAALSLAPQTPPKLGSFA